MDGEARLEALIARYTPEVSAVARQSLAMLRMRVPGAVELIYDNYNALAVAFSPTERRSDIVFSVTLYPRWVSLFFTDGADLPDPDHLLRGNGKRIRHVVLTDAATLEDPGVGALIDAALARAPTPFDATASRQVIIKSVAANQRPRRPGASA